MKIVITGGAGFIGSHLADRLVENNKVVVLDNLSSGKKEFIKQHAENPDFEFHEIDLLTSGIDKYLEGVDEVWHFAANPDIRIGIDDTKVHLEQNVLVTYRVLESMKKMGVKSMIFASTSTVYGDAEKIPTPEDFGPMEPISLYGSSKLACEAMISAYCHVFGMKAAVFRLANVIGPRSGRGVIYDFIKKLERDPSELEILGDGMQNKSYIYISDCIESMISAVRNMKRSFDVFNIGSEDQITVKEIAGIVSDVMGLKPKFRFTGGKRGWTGDIPIMMLDVSKVKKTGWKPKYDSKKGIAKTTRCLFG